MGGGNALKIIPVAFRGQDSAAFSSSSMDSPHVLSGSLSFLLTVHYKTQRQCQQKAQESSGTSPL